VSRTFKELSAYIKTDGFADLENNVIKLGDYIDLEGGITVEAYPGQGGNGGGGFSYSGASDYTRLIVVGINSFHSGRGTKPGGDGQTPNGTTRYGDADGEYNVIVNDTTPHVVFQFQNVPVERRMNPTNTNAGGYRDSEMRKYLLQKFLPGLTDTAGVPADALWGPIRFVSTKDSGNTAISDALWLPTEREMFQNGMDSRNNTGPHSDTVSETATNQARLEYYTEDDSRKKDINGVEGPNQWYWGASPGAAITLSFCFVAPIGTPDAAAASIVGGCAPAFCVK
jgi:hypothetical protein